MMKVVYPHQLENRPHEFYTHFKGNGKKWLSPQPPELNLIHQRAEASPARKINFLVGPQPGMEQIHYFPWKPEGNKEETPISVHPLKCLSTRERTWTPQ